MNISQLNAETLKSFSPNCLAEVEGEATLYEKLEPYIISSKKIIEEKFLSEGDYLTGENARLALKVIVAHAYMTAIPALDIVVTPTGFGVVKTETIAPASKERVERLITSLKEYIKAQLTVLVDELKRIPEWRETKQGKYFCATFLEAFLPVRSPLLAEPMSYETAHQIMLRYEAEMACNHLGRGLMNALRIEALANPLHPLASLVRSVLFNLLATYKGAPIPTPAWSAVQPIIAELAYHPEYLKLYEAEMVTPFNLPEDGHIKQGSFFF